MEELRLLSTLAARSVCFFIFFPPVEHLEPLQQAQFKYMYPAKPRIKTPKAKRRLRLVIKVDNSSLSKLKAKAEEAHAAKIKPKEMIEEVMRIFGIICINVPDRRGAYNYTCCCVAMAGSRGDGLLYWSGLVINFYWSILKQCFIVKQNQIILRFN